MPSAWKTKNRGKLKRGYRLRTLDVNTAGGSMPMPMRRASSAMDGLPPMPAEAGESTLSVLVSGQIELTD